MSDEARPASSDPVPSWWPWACAAVAVLAVFDAFWALSTADWKTDEAWDGRLAWMAVSNGQKTKTFSIRAGKDRDKNIQYFTIHALNQIRRFLLECV